MRLKSLIRAAMNDDPTRTILSVTVSKTSLFIDGALSCALRCLTSRSYSLFSDLYDGDSWTPKESRAPRLLSAESLTKRRSSGVNRTQGRMPATSAILLLGFPFTRYSRLPAAPTVKEVSSRRPSPEATSDANASSSPHRITSFH